MKNNWFKIWYYCLNLVAFATIETKSKKKKKKKKHTIKNVKNNQRIFAFFFIYIYILLKWYLHSWVGTISWNFKFVNTYSMINHHTTLYLCFVYKIKY